MVGDIIPFQDKLTNVHDAMKAAVLAEPEQPEYHVRTFRLPTAMNELTDRICKQHGTTMSAFLRQCCEGLVRDYTQPPRQP